MKSFIIKLFFIVNIGVLNAQIYDRNFKHNPYVKEGYSFNNPFFGTVLLDSMGSSKVVESRCNCQKNVSKNKLIIQIEKLLPSTSYKDKYLEKMRKFANIFGLFPFYEDSIGFQDTQITIYLTDNKVDSALIKRTSQEPEFDGKYKIKGQVDYFNIHLTKTSYKIASDIWGVAKLKMPIPFGWIEEDRIINIYFRCNNSRINKTLEIPHFNSNHEDDY